MCKTQDFKISPNYAHEEKYWKRICVNFYWQKEKKIEGVMLEMNDEQNFRLQY